MIYKKATYIFNFCLWLDSETTGIIFSGFKDETPANTYDEGYMDRKSHCTFFHTDFVESDGFKIPHGLYQLVVSLSSYRMRVIFCMVLQFVAAI